MVTENGIVTELNARLGNLDPDTETANQNHCPQKPDRPGPLDPW